MLRSERLRRLLVPLLVLSAWPARAGNEPVVWTMAGVAPDGSPIAEWGERTARVFEKATGGLIKIRTRFGAVLGDEVETLGLLRAGRVHLFGGSVGAFEELLPVLNVLETPYLFTDAAALDRASKSEPFWLPPVQAQFRKQGLEPWGLCFAGWRSMATVTTPVRVPADLRRVRMRFQPAPLHDAMWKALGARGRAVPLPGVQDVLVRGELDGLDVPLLWLFGTSATEKTRYYTRTSHMAQAAVMVTNRAAMDKLPASARQRVAAEAKRLMVEFNHVTGKLDDDLLESLRARGVTVIDLSPEERAQWQAALAPVREVALKLGGPAAQVLLKHIEKALQAK